jgi:hypothetical protein
MTRVASAKSIEVLICSIIHGMGYIVLLSRVKCHASEERSIDNLELSMRILEGRNFCIYYHVGYEGLSYFLGEVDTT